MVGTRKQSLSHEQFRHIADQATKLVSRSRLDRLIDRGAEDIRAKVAGRDAAYAWSGGKDSIALRLVCEAAGVNECVMGISSLEYPAFLQWVTERMPDRLQVTNTGLDLDWLREHPQMLFPQDANTAAKWFQKIQHRAQADYYREHDLGVILLGRRTADGNFIGRGGENIYTSKGVTRLSPIAEWSHTEVFAAIEHYGLALPPFYHWPRGYRCGTHAWAARQWCEDEAHGWSEIYGIDPYIVETAAAYMPGAAAHMEHV